MADIETTVVSDLTSRPSRDVVIAGHQQVSHEWWGTQRKHDELCISRLVLDEAAAAARLAVLQVDDGFGNNGGGFEVGETRDSRRGFAGKGSRRRAAYRCRGRACGAISADVELSAFGQCVNTADNRIGLCRRRVQCPNDNDDDAQGTLGAESVNDSIVEDVRRIREGHAARFDDDLDAIFQDIKQREQKSGHTFDSGVVRKTVTE